MKIHFGEIDPDNEPNYRGYFVKSGVTPPGVSDEHLVWKDNPFTKKFDFFTNQPNKQGVPSYDWPFYFDPDAKITVYDSDTNNTKPVFKYNGVLTNMWRGCEPVCAILSKLLKNGVFCSYPWNPGVGYMFRKNVPKLVFVFANEFDNQYTSTYTYINGQKIWTTVVVPSAQNDNIIFTTRKSNGSSTQRGILGTYETKTAIDPYCLKQLHEDTASSANATFT